MATIHYSLAGEGRGHAVRARTVIEHLAQRHDVTVFAPRDAYDFLAPLYERAAVRVERIPGLCFAYRGERLDPARTALGACRYLAGLPGEVRRLARRLDADRCDLVITDFEPSLPRAAKAAGVPFVSLDHQHFLTTVDLTCLPWRLRAWAAAAGLVVRAYYRGESASIVSSFYDPPTRAERPDVHHVGVLLRPELLKREPSRQPHLLGYLRRGAPRAVLDVLAESPLAVRLSGLGKLPDRGALRFREISEAGFLDDLASCEAIISTAGNQLVGEALALHKPVLAMPEPGNREQEINGHFLAASGAGRSLAMSAFTAEALREFLDGLEAHRESALARRRDGTPRVLSILEELLARLPSERRAQRTLQPLLEAS